MFEFAELQLSNRRIVLGIDHELVQYLSYFLFLSFIHLSWQLLFPWIGDWKTYFFKKKQQNKKA
jgi:hypothetical protein